MNSGRFFFDDGNSRKFWSYTQRGKKQAIRHGRIGSSGRESVKTFASASAAVADTEKLINQKLKKGYVAIDPAKLTIKRPKGRRLATESQVAKLEKQLNATLPSEYREFLLTQNGGVPDPCFVEIRGHPYIENVAVGYILGLYSKAEPYESLLYAVDHFMPSLPKGELPIAREGDLFSISLIHKPGCIYFWDHEAPECEDEDDDGNVKFKMAHATLLAGSFYEFLTRIALFDNDASTGA